VGTGGNGGLGNGTSGTNASTPVRMYWDASTPMNCFLYNGNVANTNEKV
jgi:hypothetical protein